MDKCKILSNSCREGYLVHLIYTTISRYGLSRYRFHYPNFDLCITRDVFESAAGGRYPIFSIAFYLPGEGVSSELEQYLYAEDGTMVDTRAEDWGLQFSVEEAGADHILLNATQENGQQLGTLTIQRYSIYNTAEGRRIIHKASNNGPPRFEAARCYPV